MPSDGSRYIEWGFSDSSLRLYSTETGKVKFIYKVFQMDFLTVETILVIKRV